MDIKSLNKYKCFDGWQKQFSHESTVLNCSMQFSIFLPPQVNTGEKVPVVYWLSGLTCTDENFVQKAGAQRIAAQLGIALVVLDTSPRGDSVADAPDGAYDLGKGAGFYLNATEEPWRSHYKMYDYVTQELPQLIEEHFPVTDKRSISGHSMGGHGALTIALKNPSDYQSVSAFSPIVNPMNCPWGKKAFTAYLGKDTKKWEQYDTCKLMSGANNKLPMLVDQGGADTFLTQQLMPESLELVAKNANYPVSLRYQAGYDHSYFFIASFIEEHLKFHSQYLS